MFRLLRVLITVADTNVWFAEKDHFLSKSKQKYGWILNKINETYDWIKYICISIYG